MKLNQIKLLAISCILLLTELFSENLTQSKTQQQKKYESGDQSAWTISHNFESTSNYSEAIIIPFNYPFEAKLVPDQTASQVHFKTELFLPSNQFLFLGQSNTNSGKVVLKPSENTEMVSYRSNIITDNNHYARDTNSRMPSLWQTNSAMANTSSGVVFVYLKKNMGLNLDLSFRMAGNDAGHAVFESLVSNLNFTYKLSDKIFHMNPNYKLNMVLQISSTQYSDDRVIPKKLEFNRTSLKSQFVSSGFTLNTKSLMFEGLIRLPVQQQAVFDLDGLLRPELQGRLGMKWYLPEYIQP
jgi:hypothetical protein